MTKQKVKLSKSYGGGISVKYSPANQAWFVMWHGDVLRVVSDFSEADRYARSLVR